MHLKPKAISPYAKIIKEELILRDHLAADRTILANERTLLAYARTALTMFIVGVSLIKFFNSDFSRLLGLSFIFFCISVLIVGFIRYIEIRRIIHDVKNRESQVTLKAASLDNLANSNVNLGELVTS